MNYFPLKIQRRLFSTKYKSSYSTDKFLELRKISLICQINWRFHITCIETEHLSQRINITDFQ